MNIPAFLTFKKDHRFCDDPFPFLPNIKKKERWLLLLFCAEISFGRCRLCAGVFC